MAPDIPFRRSGLGLFLLKLVQVRSAGLDWPITMYLQANQSTAAAEFYKKIGFIKTPDNDISQLPEAWREKGQESFYIKFVDDDQNQQEAHKRSD